MQISKRNPKEILQKNGKQPVFTLITQILIAVAIGVMFFLYFTHRTIPADQDWVDYTLMMSAFVGIGYIGTQIATQQPLFPRPDQLLPFNINSGIRALIIFGLMMVTQLITSIVFTFSTTERAFYFVFAAVCEEVFFRVLILTVIIRINPSIIMKIVGILVQAVMFVAIHQNYYGNITMMVGVFIGGIILGICYVIWEDPTANILGHFILNLFVINPFQLLLNL
jgi:membrane protease YdiL (CAAX protease family)